jgi:hypothetical protein
MYIEHFTVKLLLSIKVAVEQRNEINNRSDEPFISDD